MQSSLVVTLRALIMLAALVACPLLALQGVELPEPLVRLAGVLKERAVTLLESSTVATANASPAPQEQLELELPLRHPIAARGATAAPLAQPIAVEYSAPPWNPTAAVTPAAPAIVPQPPAAGPREPAPGASHMTALEQELRALGAHSYVLETWGDEAGLYRFQCQVAVHDDPNYHRHFQAVGSDPLWAMQEVLAQVSTWRAAAPR